MDARIYKGSYNIANKTATAGTAFTGLVWPKAASVARIVKMSYLCGSTAHTLSILKSQGTTTVTTAAAASATTLILANTAPYTGETLAASDYVVVTHTDGSYGAYLISSISGSTITIPALSVGVAAGSTLWAMYEVARTVGPAPSIQHLVTVSVDNIYFTESPEVGMAAGGTNEPLLIHSNNATAQGWLRHVNAIYTRI